MAGGWQTEGMLSGDYKLIIAAKELWRLSSSISAGKALVAAGKEEFKRLMEVAGAYGELLNLLGAYKWIDIKPVTHDTFRAAYKLKTEKRSIDLLREAYRRNNVEASAEPLNRGNGRRRNGVVVIAGVVLSRKRAASAASEV